MFNVGEIISYRATGVCRVEDIREESFTGETKTYYILKPVTKNSATIYVPLDNATLCERMGALLTKAEARAILKQAHGDAGTWIEDVKTRQTVFHETISGGDRLKIAAVVCALARHRREVAEAGRKFYASDERLLAAAENAIVGELSYVLECDEQEILDSLCAEGV